MSKEAALRAMREARFNERPSRPTTGATTGTTTGTTASAAPPTKAARKAPVTPVGAAAATSSDEAVCGYSSKNGRTCIRELGHAAKTHRYS